MYRIKHGEPDLLEFASDSDVREAYLMRKSVNRDIHKFHAFVRFRSVKCGVDDIFVAWHCPDHWTVELATPFFARRFGSMRFSILTPKGCAHWDLKKLTFSSGVARDQTPQEDAFEDYWLTYYRSIFNPFRLKEKAMKREFPVRHWPTLPESRLIPELIEEASGLASDRDD
ncbi:TIGR03915 family putative DNA repair protein [Leptolyngbya sp. 15MV]|nr:TIGR03915 family putative DNA repair protein [Leptolyngbya sp. 15MV]